MPIIFNQIKELLAPYIFTVDVQYTVSPDIEYYRKIVSNDRTIINTFVPHKEPFYNNEGYCGKLNNINSELFTDDSWYIHRNQDFNPPFDSTEPGYFADYKDLPKPNTLICVLIHYVVEPLKPSGIQELTKKEFLLNLILENVQSLDQEYFSTELCNSIIDLMRFGAAIDKTYKLIILTLVDFLEQFTRVVWIQGKNVNDYPFILSLYRVVVVICFKLVKDPMVLINLVRLCKNYGYTDALNVFTDHYIIKDDLNNINMDELGYMIGHMPNPPNPPDNFGIPFNPNNGVNIDYGDIVEFSGKRLLHHSFIGRHGEKLATIINVCNNYSYVDKFFPLVNGSLIPNQDKYFSELLSECWLSVIKFESTKLKFQANSMFENLLFLYKRHNILKFENLSNELVDYYGLREDNYKSMIYEIIYGSY